MPTRAFTDSVAVRRALVCCARVDLDVNARAELIALASAGLDFAALVDEAHRQTLTPLVSRHVHADLSTLCPRHVLTRLSESTRATVLKSLSYAAELVEVIRLLREAGVSALAVKGPVSAALCYGDLGLRMFNDLDLLIAPADVASAMKVLRARGYAPDFGLSPAWHERLVRTGSEELLRNADGRRLVDLHWVLLPRGYSFTPGNDEIFAREQRVRVGDSDVPTLSNEATLLFLLLHGMKHDWESLAWLCDVAELTRRGPALDWDAILAWSARPGRRRMVDVGLRLARELLDAPVPGEAQQRGAGDPAVVELVEVIKTRFLAPQPEGPPSLLGRSVGSLQFRAMELASDRLRFLHDVLLRPTLLEWQAVPLPPALAPLHYVVRPIRLLWKHAVPSLGRPR